MFKTRIILILSYFVSGCATVPVCGTGQKAGVQDLVYLGTDTPTGPVSPEDWSAFLSEVVTPRFPEGFSVWPASGQWRSAAGPIVKEQTFVLSLVHSDDDAAEKAVRKIIESYKSRFRQEAVLRVSSAVCLSL